MPELLIAIGLISLVVAILFGISVERMSRDKPIQKIKKKWSIYKKFKEIRKKAA